VDTAIADMGGVDIFLIAHGTLPDQEAIKNDAEKTVHEFAINATSVINLCTVISSKLEESGRGKLAVISSVAGERGRKALYTYSAAKSAVTEFLSGLRQRFSGNDKIKIITLKPGVIESPMTSHMPKSPLMAGSDKAGKLIYQAIEKGTEVAYVPGFWKPIMGVIKSIPEGIFKKLEF
jgi:short-subunit dehydrogenase